MVAFGTLFRLGYSGVVGFEGMNQGLFGLTVPSPGVLWEITVGTKRGLVWVAPALLLGAWGLIALGSRRETRGLAWTAGATAAAVLLVNAAYAYWDGGNSTGPRHALPAAGMLALGVAAFWGEREPGRTRWLAAAVLGVSLVINLLIAAGDVMASPEHDWPVKRVVWDMRVAQGQMRTLPSSFWGWTSWAGLTVYLLSAIALLWWLVDRAREAPRVGGIVDGRSTAHRVSAVPERHSA